MHSSKPRSQADRGVREAAVARQAEREMRAEVVVALHGREERREAEAATTWRQLGESGAQLLPAEEALDLGGAGRAARARTRPRPLRGSSGRRTWISRPASLCVDSPTCAETASNATSAAGSLCWDGRPSCRVMSRRATGLVPHVSGVSFGVFSRASFVIQPRPRLKTLLDGAGPQRSGPRGAPDFEIELREALYF